MIKIRLARMGKKKKPTYRFIVSDSHKDLYGRALEILGHYNPGTKVCEVKKDRILYWISCGAKLSPTVHNIFIDQNVITGDKVVASKGKKKSGDATPVAAPSVSPAAEAPAPEKTAEVKSEEKTEEKAAEKPAE